MARKRPRGTVGQRKTRAGWWCRYWDARGKRRCVYGGETEDAARAKLEQLVRRDDDVRHGVSREVMLATFAADELFPLLRGRLAPKSFEAISGRILAAAEHFGERAMIDVTAGEAEEFLAKLTRTGRSPLTVTAYRSALSVAWKIALRRQAVTANVWAGLPVPQAHQHHVVFKTEDELDLLYAKCPKSLRPFVILLGETGMRRGEALALRWRDVAEDFSSLTVVRSKTRVVRRVPLLGKARAMLMTLPRGNEDRRVFSWIARDWTWKWRRLWKKAKRRAKFPRKWRIHDLRHCRTSLLVRAGVPIPTVSRWVGMSSALVLMRYGLHGPANELENAMMLAEAARQRSDQGPPA